nr:class I SAM-dependent methyltransferase [Jeotgalibacillus malaysiensis]
MKRYIEKWLSEEKESFSGWDFSRLNGRTREEDTPWDYKKIVLDALQEDMHLLDMGTGGGEFLLTLGHPYEKTAVTEGWEPNVELCREKLGPLGIRVEQVLDDTKLPFEDGAFDLIINRHEAYDVSEVKRILKPDGLFITQQVGGRNNDWLSSFLIPGHRTEYDEFCLVNEAEKFRTAGFNLLDQQEAFPKMRFYDVGAIVYYAKVIEWEFPGFSVEKQLERLVELQKTVEKTGYVESLEHRFLIIAKNR